ncbi:MAG: hypothetical protein EOO68_02145 [Moraxellaceae bacterium]|nr:MAG: hypothetical protein EOO68_02145 [Moraxellaceae bacterium]
MAMKTYPNGVTGPNLEQCDIINFDLKDAQLQFCLPEQSSNISSALASEESLKNWQSTIKLKLLAKNEWEYTARDEAGEWSVASVFMDMKLINLELDEFESWLGAKPYCLLKKDELSRLAIEYFIKSAVDRSRDFYPEISVEEALKRYRIFTAPEDLLLSKQDLLPWYTNKLECVDGNESSLIQTFIPISERAVILFLFDITELTFGDRPFYFTSEECQAFGDMLRDEFLSYVKITYSPEIQEKINLYAQP